MPFVFTVTRSELVGENGEADFRKKICILSSSALEFTKENNLCHNLSSKFTIELAESFSPDNSQPKVPRSHPIGYQEIVELFDKEAKRSQNARVKFKIFIKWTNQVKHRTNFYPTMCTNVNKIAIVHDADPQQHFPTPSHVDSKLVTNLDDCLNLFTKPEKLTKDNPWYCSNCKKHQEATKQMHIWRLPKYLIVTLKRFQASKASDSIGMINPLFSHLLQNRVVYNKLNNHVNFPIRYLLV